MKTPQSNVSFTTQIARVKFNRWKFAIALLLFCFFGLGLIAAESARVKLMRAPHDGLQPQAAMDREGVVHLIYYKGEPAGAMFSPKTGKVSEPVSPMNQGSIRCRWQRKRRSAWFGRKGLPGAKAGLWPGRFTTPRVIQHLKRAERRAFRLSLATAFAKQDGNFTIIY
jgi:hypothetical protein